MTSAAIPSGRNPDLDEFFESVGKWEDEFKLLRRINLSYGLTEELKWGQPCYLHQGRMILLIHGFKDYCAVLFMKGALLTDPGKLLIQQTKNVQSARQLRFTGIQDILAAGNVLSWFIHEAIDVEKSGKKVRLKTTAEFETPAELLDRFQKHPELKAAFDRLTPGRQRGYLLHFSGAKQAKTRDARVDKAIPRILDGKGLDD